MTWRVWIGIWCFALTVTAAIAGWAFLVASWDLRIWQTLLLGDGIPFCVLVAGTGAVVTR